MKALFAASLLGAALLAGPVPALAQDAAPAAAPDAQTQYASDLAAYESALHAHNRAVRINDHKQRAYADAMADWRRQVADCQDGDNRACKAPPPDPADYW